MEALELEPMLSDDSQHHSQSPIPIRPLLNGKHKKIEDKESTSNEKKVSYRALLQNNRPFTLYLCSYITNHVGEWLTYLASLTALTDMMNKNHVQEKPGNESTMIGTLVALRLLTNVIASPWGGALADAVDRRQAMIAMDLAGAVIAWLFLAAVHLQSPTLIFIATCLQEIDSGLYEPSRSAIVPLLCPTDEELEKATLLTGMAWSIVAATASAAGGVLVTLLGCEGCFIVDSLTYVVSALFMTGLDGDWTVAATPHSSQASSSSSHTSPCNMVQHGFTYLRHQPWGPLVALKFSATWLTMDVLMVSFAKRGEHEEHTPLRLGALFGAVGLGCLIGPPLADQFTNLQRPQTVQRAAIAALALSTISCFTISLGLLKNRLTVLCALTVLRSSGVSTLWVQSSLLLQKFCDPTYLGRISSIDYGLALVGEACSALVTGWLRDAAGWSPEQVCAWLALLGGAFTTFWMIFTVRGGGATAKTEVCASGIPRNDFSSSLSEAARDGEDETESTFMF